MWSSRTRKGVVEIRAGPAFGTRPFFSAAKCRPGALRTSLDAPGSSRRSPPVEFSPSASSTTATARSKSAAAACATASTSRVFASRRFVSAAARSARRTASAGFARPIGRSGEHRGQARNRRHRVRTQLDRPPESGGLWKISRRPRNQTDVQMRLAEARVQRAAFRNEESACSGRPSWRSAVPRLLCATA